MARPLDLSTIERVGPAVLASNEEIDALERELGFRVPSGYREYLTQLGEGVLHAWMRVLAPWAIVDQLEEHRGLKAAYWFWDPAGTGFGQAEAIESIPLATTLDGDEIVCHPGLARLFILPRHRERVYARDPDLLEVIGWMGTAGVIRRFGSMGDFEPFDTRAEIRSRGRPSLRDRVRAKLGRVGPPDAREPREVLLSYLAAMGDLEREALSGLGQPSPDVEPDMAAIDDLADRADAIRRGHCTAGLAAALSGMLSFGSELEHDPATTRIVDETELPMGRVRLRTEEGRDPAETREYTFERIGGAWRIASVSET